MPPSCSASRRLEPDARHDPAQRCQFVGGALSESLITLDFNRRSLQSEHHRSVVIDVLARLAVGNLQRAAQALRHRFVRGGLGGTLRGQAEEVSAKHLVEHRKVLAAVHERRSAAPVDVGEVARRELGEP